MKFITDILILCALFLALYILALGVKYTVNVIPRTLNVTLEQVR